MSATKVCRKCGIEKPLNTFGRILRSPDGRRGVCHRCRAGRAPAPYVGEAPTEKDPRFFRTLSGKRFIITAAQSETFVDEDFFAALEVAAKHLDAELVVIPLRYKNPTSQAESRSQEDKEWFAPEVIPYLHNVRKKLCEHLVLAADVKTSPTASSPLTGFESLTGAESCIIGHPKMQFRTIPVPSGPFPKILTTTGACTRRNYSKTKAGAIGNFHHFLGAVIVELDGPLFHLRQLNADRTDGSFIDLDKHYTTTGVHPAPPALALVMGDTHVRVTDPAVDRATFGAAGMVDVLQPKTLVFHDLIDGETVNPHDVGDPFIAEAKRSAGRLDVRAELQEMVDFVNARAKGRDAVIVDSNHHDFLRRWMVKTDWRQDLKNAAFYLETALHMYQSARMTSAGAEYADPFRYWVPKLGCMSNIRCLLADESCKVDGIECGLHGHNGPSGAKGSLKNLSRLGVRVISGHGHSPGIEEGHYRVGTSTPRRLTYQRGPNASLNTHCVVYANGKRALLNVIEGRWRAPDETSIAPVPSRSTRPRKFRTARREGRSRRDGLRKVR